MAAQDEGARASVVEDDDIPAKAWREAGYSVDAVRQEMRRRGEQVTALTVEPLSRLGIEAEVQSFNLRRITSLTTLTSFIM